MSIFTILTLIFVVLKLMNYIDWSWWLVVTPSIIHAVLYVAVHVWWESLSPETKLKIRLGL